ncbi:MAG: helix-turn-helix domain-containing protein [Proteobacteria bacterium]|nr:helix-turn-helix domain-containing protein [Pseudomonadota bacterium]MDA1059902.1 helix-turn-helix domain-containing protein [Pseudomonadota bacterium]
MTARRSECPIAYALDLLGDRWTLLIVRDVALHGKRYFHEFENAGERIATNILTDRLKLLVENGILKKARDPEKGSRRLYQLTDKGADLLPLILELIIWSGKHDPRTVVSDGYMVRATRRRASVLREMRKAAQ